jgi:hypothetical protein
MASDQTNDSEHKHSRWGTFGDRCLMLGLLLFVGGWLSYCFVAQSYGLGSPDDFHKLPQRAPHWQVWSCKTSMGLGAICLLIAVFEAVSGGYAARRCSRCGRSLARVNATCPKCECENEAI